MKVKEESEKAGLKLNIQKTKTMASGPITSRQTDGETTETATDFIFLGSKITVDGDCSHEIKRCLLLGRKAMTNLDRILKSRDVTLPTKICLVKAIVFPVIMYRCERWTIKKAEAEELMLLNCGVGEDSWESLGHKIKPVHPKGNQSWIFIGRTDAQAEAPVLWPSDMKNWLIWKHPDARNDWRKEEKGTKEDEMVGWHHRLDGHEFKQAPGVGDGQGSLACCSSWGRSRTRLEQQNWTDSRLTNNVVIVSGEQKRDSARLTCIHSSPTPLPSRLPHNIEQSSICYTAAPWWLSILNIAVYKPAFLIPYVVIGPPLPSG